MPTVEKTVPGRVSVRDIGEFTEGDRAEVTAGEAEYLVEERGGFEIVDDAGGDAEPADEEVHEEDGPPDDRVPDGDLADIIDAGRCPWCADYEGENVGMHASSAHPDEWDAYKED